MEFQGGNMMREHHFDNLGLAGKITQKLFLNEKIANAKTEFVT
jgi:hypothetical protein